MKKEKTLEVKAKADDLIKKSKKLNLIKPLTSAFESTPCEKEIQ